MHQLSRYKCSNLTLHRSSMNSSPAGHQINHFHLLHSLHNTKQRNSFPIGSVCCLSPILPTFSPMRKSSVTNNFPTTSSLLHSGPPTHLNAGRAKDETRNNEDQLLPPTHTLPLSGNNLLQLVLSPFLFPGVIVGIGAAMVRESAAVMLGHYFKRRRQFVEMITMSGEGVGVALFSVILKEGVG